MPAFNAENCIAEAIDSVLSQSFTDYEFIIINDGSADLTADIIDSYDDGRIRHLKLPENYGAIAAANLGLAEVNAPYIIRMDTDAVSLPGRFARLVDYMEMNPGTGVCGSSIAINNEGFFISNPQNSDDIVARMLFENPVSNSSAIFRTSLIREKGFRYRDQFPRMAEYDLWYRLKNITTFSNLPEPLVKVSPRLASEAELLNLREIKKSFFVDKLNQIGIRPSIKALELHTDLSDPAQVVNLRKPGKYRKWLNQLNTTNDIVYAFPRDAIHKEIEYRWNLLFKNYEEHNPDAAIEWLRISGKPAPYIWKYWVQRLFK
jgi:glycosyltransferase involved in cell wall biosynthesis